MQISSPLIFFGNERLSSGFTPSGAPTLQALSDNGYKVAAVVVNHEVGRSRKVRELEIELVAKKNNIPVLLPENLTSIKQTLIDYDPIMGMLVAYGKIVPQAIIDIFPRGIINIHPSLLPLYRGPTPIEQALLDGASETGVSLMKLVKEMDAGPIFAQSKVKLIGSESKQELTNELLSLGSQLLIEHLPAILHGTLSPLEQQYENATYTKLLSKSDGTIDLKKSGLQLEREIRAFQTWPKSKIKLYDKYNIIVIKSRAAKNADDGSLVIKCGGGTFLEIQELTAPSGRVMSSEDFLRGYNKN